MNDDPRIAAVEAQLRPYANLHSPLSGEIGWGLSVAELIQAVDLIDRVAGWIRVNTEDPAVVETVARAIHEAHLKNFPWDEQTGWTRDRQIVSARAVLAALRTEATR